VTDVSIVTFVTEKVFFLVFPVLTLKGGTGIRTARSERMAQQNPFASDMANTQLYVKVSRSGIQMLVVYTDGLTITTFNKGKTPYLSVPDVIDWHEKEMAYTHGKDKEKREHVVEHFRKVMQDFETVRGQYGDNTGTIRGQYGKRVSD